MPRPSALVAYGGDESDEGSDEEPQESGSEGENGSAAESGDEQLRIANATAEFASPLHGRSIVASPAANGSERPGSASIESPAATAGVVTIEQYPFSTRGIVLPPAPPGLCDPDLQERVRRFMAKKREGYHFNEKLRSNKEFQNPHICEKLVEHLALDEFGSNCPKEIFSPTEFGEEFFYENLAAEQRKWMEKKGAARTKIEFTAAAASAPSPTPTGAATVATAATAAAAAAAAARQQPIVARGLPPPKKQKI